MVVNEGAGVTYSVPSNTHNLIIINTKSCERSWIQCKNGSRFVQVALLLSEIRHNETNTELKRSFQLQWNDKWNQMVFFSVSAVSPTLGMLPTCQYSSSAKDSKHQWHEWWSTTCSECENNKVLWAGLFPNKANKVCVKMNDDTSVWRDLEGHSHHQWTTSCFNTTYNSTFTSCWMFMFLFICIYYSCLICSHAGRICI